MNQNFLENLKSASWFRLIDWILAITFYLPVWHSHCTRSNFTVLVWCSDELAVHSYPLLYLQTQKLRNFRAHCSTVALCCITITWQPIFKGSLEVTIVMCFSACDCWPQTSLTGSSPFVWASSSSFVERVLLLSTASPPRYRSRYWAAIRLSHRPEPSGRVVRGGVDGLDSGGRHDRRFVLRHTHRPQRRPYPICTSSHSIKLRAFLLSAVTALLQCPPRRLCSTATCPKRLLFDHYLKWTFEDLLPCYCYAIKTNDNTIRLLVSQLASAGKRADMNELQIHHCMKPE